VIKLAKKKSIRKKSRRYRQLVKKADEAEEELNLLKRKKVRIITVNLATRGKTSYSGLGKKLHAVKSKLAFGKENPIPFVNLPLHKSDKIINEEKLAQMEVMKIEKNLKGKKNKVTGETIKKTKKHNDLYDLENELARINDSKPSIPEPREAKIITISPPTRGLSSDRDLEKERKEVNAKLNQGIKAPFNFLKNLFGKAKTEEKIAEEQQGILEVQMIDEKINEKNMDIKEKYTDNKKKKKMNYSELYQLEEEIAKLKEAMK